MTKPNITLLDNPETKEQLIVACTMLEYRRPAGSKSEAEFIKRFIAVLPGIKKDKYGNYYLKVGDNPKTMFTAHTDTVHKHPGKQKITTDGQLIYTDDTRSNCLGADDGIGIFIMLEMIKAKAPGYYAFFREEEIGGLGSTYAVNQYNDRVKFFSFIDNVDYCVSFDRMGASSIITHQGSRCCSTDYASDLITAFLAAGPGMVEDDTGTFTDSANFVDIIPECTNVSVGYYNQHSKQEYVNFAETLQILEACKKIKWDALVIGDKTKDLENYYNFGQPLNSSEYFEDWQIVDQLQAEYPDVYSHIIATLSKDQF